MDKKMIKKLKNIVVIVARTAERIVREIPTCRVA